jgi:hypothetical protein
MQSAHSSLFVIKLEYALDIHTEGGTIKYITMQSAHRSPQHMSNGT